MVRRSEAQWRGLFEAHAQSGLSAVAFCKEHQLCPRYFSLRKRQLLQPGSPFVEAVASKSEEASIRLRYRDTVLHLGGDVSPQWVAQLIRAL